MLDKIKEYDIILACNLGDLAVRIDAKVKEGWVPLFNITTIETGYCQSIGRIKPTKEELASIQNPFPPINVSTK